MESFAFCSDKLLFTIRGYLLSYDILTGSTLTVPLTENVTDVETGCCCCGWCESSGGVGVVWNRYQNVSSIVFHLSRDGGMTFQRKEIKSVGGCIQRAHILHSHSSVALLVRHNSNTARFWYYSYGQSKDVHLTGIPFSVFGRVQTVLVGAGDIEMLLWDEEKLHYSANGGQSFLPVYDTSLSRSVFVYSDHNRPVQILSDRTDSFVLVAHNGDIYIGKAGILPHIKKITQISVPPATAVSFSSEPSIVLWSLLNISDSTSDIQRVQLTGDLFYPLEGSAHVCKVIMSLLYLWQLPVTSDNPSIVNTDTDLTVSEIVDKGIRESKMTVNISLVASTLPIGEKESARGMSNIKISLLDPNPSCMASTSKTTHIVAGCPSYKSIRVRRDVYDPYFLQGTGDSDWSDLTVQYDYWKLGCPHRAYYGFVYKPVLELYEYNIFKEVVVTDFVLLEVHGMHNYHYTKTAEQAGCTRKPQSWLEMLSQQEEVNPYTAWTRENYEDCLSGSGATFDKQQSYEILSNGTSNGIKFSQYNGIYIFNVTVLDKDYSFCQLSTQFAVEVFGAFPKTQLSPLTIMMYTCLVGLIGTVLFYIIDVCYLRDGEEEEEEEVRRDSFPY
ncbi:Cation channel sperm-associated protein subunit delta [Holothuria leucospilota]|uniref:Cation channel sperm-associated auxiliary subunit delta n=1 Tax=Holothuria leucospilota TaxID=206669 RepID=A0A9Q1BP97_HOLLE|nr:Cation channel sperm-associated protein subunit delta [Holothuria leucospilota]